MTRYRGRRILTLTVTFLFSLAFVHVLATSGFGDKTPSPLSKIPILHTQAARQNPPAVLQALYPAEPQILQIPALHIDAPVQSVGLNTKGEMEAPESQHAVGWYRLGFLPGVPGHAAMAGHSMHKAGKGVFYDLNKLAVNDVIKVLTKDYVLSFIVDGKKIYDDQAADREAVFGPAKEARLNLITCEGDWDTHTNRYAKRLVVSARYDNETPRN